MKKTEIKTPATGVIQRSNEKSFFLRFHQNSTTAERVLMSKPKYDDKPIIIIQMMAFADGYILAEIVNVEDGL